MYDDKINVYNNPFINVKQRKKSTIHIYTVQSTSCALVEVRLSEILCVVHSGRK